MNLKPTALLPSQLFIALSGAWVGKAIMMTSSFTTLKRFGLCLGALIILSIYSTTAASVGLSFYLPVGLLVMGLYAWVVSTKFQNIYPVKTRAVGQLCITFLILALSSSNQLKHMLASMEAGEHSADGVIFTAAIYHAQVTIAAMMTFILFVAYVVLKILQIKREKA